MHKKKPTLSPGGLGLFNRLYLIIALLFYSGFLAGQNYNEARRADSLKVVKLNERFDILFKGKQTDAARAVVDSAFAIVSPAGLNKQIAICYFNYALIEKELKNTDGFIRNMEATIPWYLKAKYLPGVGSAHFYIGQALMKSDYPKAIEHFEASLEIRTKIPDSVGMANNLINLGTLNYQLSNYSKANDYFYRALNLAGQMHNDAIKAIALNNLSNIHNKLKNYSLSLDYLAQALEIHQKSGNRQKQALVLANFGNTYYEKGDYKQARKSFEQALAIQKEIKGNEEDMLQAYINLGMVFKAEGDTATAATMLKKSLALARKTGNKQAEAVVLNNLGSLSIKKDNTESLGLLLESLKTSSNSGDRRMILINYDNLQQYYNNKKDYKMAYSYAEKYQLLKDSIYDEEIAETIIELQTKYETAEKEKQLVVFKKEKLEQELELNRANTLKYGMIGFSLLLLISLGALYSRFMIKRRSQLQLTAINEKLNALNSTKDKLFSIVSHDLKNSMSGFSGIVNTINKKYETFSTDEIKYYIGEITASANAMKSLLRNLLDWSRSQQNLIKIYPSEINVPSLVNECFSQVRQEIRQKGIVLKLDADDDLSLFNDKNVVYAVVRNVLVNAVKYSYEGGLIEIKSKKLEGITEISIKDHGMGMDKDKLAMLMSPNAFVKSEPGVEGEKGAGLGLMLTRELLEKVSGKMEVNSVKGEGSTFRILLPDLKNLEIPAMEII
ncbi:MAG: sensor histidine kinase [Lentimicrobium sp.]|nr:sensor histidine kinase [Lentimicrobium sp.]